MPAFICDTCGSQFTPSEAPPPGCPVCQDERQYVPSGGQRWTTLEVLARGHFNSYRQHEPGLIGIGTVPKFSIGQRALLLLAAGGNILWDCIPFIDAATVEIVKGLGGLSAIAISHPHYYGTMVEWSRAFGGVPVHLHAADRQWIMRPDPIIALWEGDTLPLASGVTLVRCGGHFGRRNGAALGGGRGGARCAVVGRRGAGDPRSQPRRLHAQLSQHHSAVGTGGGADRRCARAVCLRRDLWRGLRPRRAAWGPGRGAAVDRPLSRDRRR